MPPSPRLTDPGEAETTSSGRQGSPVWRLILHPAADGARNMAVDEAILQGYVHSHTSPVPTLRLYAWNPPALSLGRTQKARISADREFLVARGIDLVRRPTGGRAVLHEAERTYAVIGSLRRSPFNGGVHEVYRRIARVLREALRRLGVPAGAAPAEGSSPSPRGGDGVGPACFDAPGVHEIVVGGRKVIGSAQLRRRGAFLQHGSILLDSDAARLGRAVGSSTPVAGFTDLGRLLGRPMDPGEIDRAITAACADCFGVRLEPGELTGEEADLAARLRCWKYDSAAWTLEGRSGDRERRRGPDLTH